MIFLLMVCMAPHFLGFLQNSLPRTALQGRAGHLSNLVGWGWAPFPAPPSPPPIKSLFPAPTFSCYLFWGPTLLWEPCLVYHPFPLPFQKKYLPPAFDMG